MAMCMSIGQSVCCSLLKPYLRVLRGISKTTLAGYVGVFQFLRNCRQQNAFEPAERILRAALDPAIARRAKKGEFVTWFDHFAMWLYSSGHRREERLLTLRGVFDESIHDEKSIPPNSRSAR